MQSHNYIRNVLGPVTPSHSHIHIYSEVEVIEMHNALQIVDESIESQ